jgi:hypothetical protein
VGSSAAWVLSASDRTLTRVPVGALAAQVPHGPPVRLNAAQLRINQRISQAAIRRLNALEAMIAGVPAPEGTDTRPRPVELSAGQLRINQRISQIAVWRANSLAARLDGNAPPPRPARDESPIELSAAQLRISQRIAQAAVRRINALVERVPELPVPRPSLNDPSLDKITGAALSPYAMGIATVRQGSGQVGQTVAFFLTDAVKGPGGGGPVEGDLIVGIGLLRDGVFYIHHASIEQASEREQ